MPLAAFETAIGGGEGYGKDWETFVYIISRELSWHVFEAKPSTVRRVSLRAIPFYIQDSYPILYKEGLMPKEPELFEGRSDVLYGDAAGIHPVEQGGIIYKSFDVWEHANSELAFNNNTEYFSILVEMGEIRY